MSYRNFVNRMPPLNVWLGLGAFVAMAVFALGGIAYSRVPEKGPVLSTVGDVQTFTVVSVGRGWPAVDFVEINAQRSDGVAIPVFATRAQALKLKRGDALTAERVEYQSGTGSVLVSAWWAQTPGQAPNNK